MSQDGIDFYLDNVEDPDETVDQLWARHDQEEKQLAEKHAAERRGHARFQEMVRREHRARMLARRREGASWTSLAREFGVGVSKAGAMVRQAEREEQSDATAAEA